MEELAKILVLGVLLALVMAYLQFGDSGVKAWWSSKFLGEPQPGHASHRREGTR